jgi:hypothetical protein
VSGDVNVNARSHGAVRLQAKHQRSRRQAAATVQARAHARKVNADLTISTTAPAWVSVWANLFPTSYAAWLTERASANSNGWAFGHFKQGVAVELGVKGSENAHGEGGAVVTTGTGNGNQNENSQGNNEESNENANAQANENEQGEGQGTTTVAVGVSGATGSVMAGTGTTGTTGTTGSSTGTTGTTGTTGSSTGTSGTAGEETSGSNGGGTTGSSGSESGSVLGASTSGQSGSAAANASVTPARSANSGKLPFTGTDEWLIVAAGTLMLMGGLVLRRRLADYR